MPTYPNWRVQSDDGTWHRVASWMFQYQGAVNHNWTYCGLMLDNPPFEDLHPFSMRFSYYATDLKPEPSPSCSTCAVEYPKAMRDEALRDAKRWNELVPV